MCFPKEMSESSQATSRALSMYEPNEIHGGLDGLQETGEWLRHAIFTSHFEPIMWEAPLGFGKNVLASRILIQLMLNNTMNKLMLNAATPDKSCESLVICSSELLAKQFFTKLMYLSVGCESINGMLVISDTNTHNLMDLATNRVLVTTWNRMFFFIKIKYNNIFY